MCVGVLFGREGRHALERLCGLVLEADEQPRGQDRFSSFPADSEEIGARFCHEEGRKETRFCSLQFVLQEAEKPRSQGATHSGVHCGERVNAVERR